MKKLPKSIYLAGKIAAGDWRHGIIKDLRGTFSGNCDGEIGGLRVGKAYSDYFDANDSWPVLPKAVFGLDYTGPYFVSDDHRCFHGPDSHGFKADQKYACGYADPDDHDDEYFMADAQCFHNSTTGSNRLDVIRWCLDAINRSDIVFAWIDDTTCYGTLAEIGYAKALNKIILIAGTDEKWKHTDLWFACNMANETLFAEWLTPAIAIQIFMAKQTHTIEITKAKLMEAGNRVTVNGR